VDEDQDGAVRIVIPARAEGAGPESGRDHGTSFRIPD